MNESELTTFRTTIDEIDNNIVDLLSERFKVVSQIAQFKRENSIPIEDKKREMELFALLTQKCEFHSVEVKRIFTAIYNNSKRIQRRSLNLYLIGMPGCGKSRCGYTLSNILDLPFADTDKLIMREKGQSIDEIFDTIGEPSFRKMETDMLLRLASRGGTVVATGGGVLTTPSNIPIIRSSGYIVFLDRKLDELVNQKLRNRPLLREGKEAIIRLYSERRSSYIQNADYIDNPDSRGVIGRIISSYKRFIN